MREARAAAQLLYRNRLQNMSESAVRRKGRMEPPPAHTRIFSLRYVEFYKEAFLWIISAKLMWDK